MVYLFADDHLFESLPLNRDLTRSQPHDHSIVSPVSQLLCCICLYRRWSHCSGCWRLCATWVWSTACMMMSTAMSISLMWLEVSMPRYIARLGHSALHGLSLPASPAMRVHFGFYRDTVLSSMVGLSVVCHFRASCLKHLMDLDVVLHLHLCGPMTHC